MTDTSLDARRTARDQEARLAASASIGINAMRPIVEFNTSMFRFFAESCELMARNWEKSLGAYSSVIEQQQQQH